jgi:Holliday junction resolvase
MSSYAKGRRLEYLVRDLFDEKGYVVVRAARSKPIDLVCMKNGKILLVECKTKRSNLTKDRKKELLRLAERAGASLLLAYKNKRNIKFIDLKNDCPYVL